MMIFAMDPPEVMEVKVSQAVTMVTVLGNVSTQEAEPERNEELARGEIAVQAVIFCLALFGNSSVLFALRYRKKKTSRMHDFIMHLCIADLLVAFCNILPQLAWDITHRFQGGDVLCRIVKYIQVFVMYLSTYVLLMTAIDRYQAICYPLSGRINGARRIRVMIGSAWIVSAILSLPQLFIFSYHQIRPGVYDCWGDFEPAWTLQAYVTAFTISVYILPFVALVLLYGRICHQVWQHVSIKQNGLPEAHKFMDGKVIYKFNGTGTISVLQPELDSVLRAHSNYYHSYRGVSRAKMKTIKLTFVVILAYLLCWSPFFITQMWWAYDVNAPSNNSTFVICLLLASLNSCCNPWIYMAFSGSLIQQIMPCCRRRSRQHKLHERARKTVKINSKTSSSTSGRHDLNRNPPCCACCSRHKCHCYQMAFVKDRHPRPHTFHTGSTKLTGGTMSPSHSMGIKHNHLTHHTLNARFRKHCCYNSPCYSDRCHNNCSRQSSEYVCHCSRYHSPNHAHTSNHAQYYPRNIMTNEESCNCSSYASESRSPINKEDVLFDLRSARRAHKTRSNPSLLSVPHLHLDDDITQAPVSV